MAADTGLPSISELRRLASTDGGDFLIQQDGASFAADLPLSSCQLQGPAALFTPSWSGPGSDLSNAAFALYRLTFDPAQAPVSLALEWTTTPDPANCWIGISDWSRGVWEWLPGAPGWEHELSNPERYISEQKCYVAVMLLGQAPGRLAKLGFGEPLPPLSGAGYTLIAPLNSKNTFLIDMDGTVAHTWTANYNPGASAMLLENGHLLRAANIGNPNFGGGGMGGRIAEFDWNNNVVWSYDYSTTTQVMHHDFARLPNGNILAILMTSLPIADVIEAGRNPATVDNYFWADSVIEIEPVLPSGGNIVWEWNVMNHIVQDLDPDKGGYFNPGDHPELIDINFPPGNAGDWTHANCVAYNPELDQVMLSIPMFGELWVIDHSTTKAEAAGHSGGKHGRGGDLLYRWGNPRAYRQGTEPDQQLFFNHDTHWIAPGLPGAGEILIFNNQLKGEQLIPYYSSVVQVSAPLNPDGTYVLSDFKYGPASPSWEYVGSPKESFFSPIMSSARRLRDGHTLICSGALGKVFEVDTLENVVWQYEAGSTFRALRYPYDYPGVAALQQDL